MNSYEKRIGLKTIYLTFVRHFIEMFIIFVPIAIASLIVTKKFINKTYSTSITFSKTTTFTTAHYETLVKGVKNDEVINQTVESLKADGTKHSNGKEITASEITSNLSGPSSYKNNDSSNIKFTLTMSEKGIIQPILNYVGNYAVQYLKNNEDTVKEFATLAVDSASNVATNDSSNKYLLIALVADLVLSLAVPFIFEIVGDQVYDKDDISYLGCSGFELNASKVSK